MFSNSKRSQDTPMDWEWQNTSGPLDPTSPFAQLKGQHRRGFESSKPQGSFASTSSTTAPPFRNPSFTTPRKAFDPELFSETSGAESSPADNADAEDTPELSKNLKAMTAFDDDSTMKQPIFGRYGAGFLGSSPGRAEQRRGKFGNALAQKVRKRKRIERDYAIIQSGRVGSDSDSEIESRPRNKNKQPKTDSRGWFWSILHSIESHPNVPNVLSYYTQFLLNLTLTGAAVFGLYLFWTSVQADVNKAANFEISKVRTEMQKCASEFVANGCSLPRRAPALDGPCEAWDFCMNQDPLAVGRAKISATTFAQIFNNFIEPISYKAMIFVVVIIIAAIAVNNLAFGMFRKPTNPHPIPSYFAPPTPAQNYHWGAPPQTPQHHQNGIQYDIYGTPFPAIMPRQTSGQRSPSKGRSPSRGNRSPSKGDRY